MIIIMEQEGVTALDVAAYILEKQLDNLTAIKLQKLVYYSQAWYLAWQDSPLFEDKIEAWVNGPVVRNLYEAHRGKYFLTAGDIAGDLGKLSDSQKQIIDLVCERYGHLNGAQLSELTHSERPWQDARQGLEPDAPSCKEISLESIEVYYQAKLSS